MSKEVTRTITRTTIRYAAINEQGDVYDDAVTVIGKYDQEQAQKYVTKQGVIGRVTTVDSVDVIWGISEEDFLKYGHEVTRPASQSKKVDDSDNATDNNNN